MGIARTPTGTGTITVVIAAAAAACTVAGSDAPLPEDPVPILDDTPPATAVDVFVIALQSNAVGGGRVEDLPEHLAHYAQPFPQVKHAYQIDCPRGGVDGPCTLVQGWTDLRPRPPRSRFGIELTAGRRLHERFGSVALIKTATSATGVGAEWEPDAPGRWQWQYMVDFIDARMAELPLGSRIAGLMLVGCEGDAHDPRLARALDGELAYFIMRFRQEYGDVPVVISELNANLNHTAEVRERQHRVADHVPGVAVVPTSDLTFRDVDVHYDAASFITLGTRMADAFPARARAPGR